MFICNICYDNFEKDSENEPKIMECGDTFCIKCIKHIKKDKDKFMCPVCQKDIYENIEDMPINQYVFNQKKTILCDICLMEFSNNYKSERSPRVLLCGHTFCTKCLQSKSGSEITCMFCGKKTKGDATSCRINKMIIEKIEDEIINTMKYIDDSIEISKVDNDYSVGLMGEAGGGKTSINYFFRTGQELENSASTIGYDYVFKYVKFKERTVKLSLIDTAGQERFGPLSAGVLKGVYGLLLVFSLTPILVGGEQEIYKKADSKMKKELEEKYKEKTFERLEFWLNQFYQFNTVDKAIIYLLGNKVDDVENRVIKYKDPKAFANKYSLKYYETSAKTGQNINKVFFDLINDLLRTFPNKTGKDAIKLKKKKSKNNTSGICC